VDANGVAYVGDDDGRVYALDPVYARGAGHLGAPKWSFATKDVIQGAPTLSPDGQTLYVGSNDGFVYALKTSDGSKIWATDFGGPVNGSPVLSSDGSTLYDANINGTFKALKASDGSVLLSRNLNGGIRGNLALSPDGSTLYAALTTSQLNGIPVGGNGGNTGITAFYLDGPPIGSPAVDPQGNVYITTGAGTLMSFAASNTTPRAGYPFVIPNRATASTTPAISKRPRALRRQQQCVLCRQLGQRAGSVAIPEPVGRSSLRPLLGPVHQLCSLDQTTHPSTRSTFRARKHGRAELGRP